MTVTPGGPINSRFTLAFPAAPGNNPSFLSAFVGQAANGTGDGTVGRLQGIEPSSSVNVPLQFDFSPPLPTTARFLVSDVDFGESHRIQALVQYRVTYQPVPLTGWGHEPITGGTGQLPDATWPTWDAATGTLTATAGGPTNDPGDLFTPDRAIDRVVFTRISGDPSATPVVQFVDPATVVAGHDQLAVNGTVSLGGGLNLSGRRARSRSGRRCGSSTTTAPTRRRDVRRRPDQGGGLTVGGQTVTRQLRRRHRQRRGADADVSPRGAAASDRHAAQRHTAQRSHGDGLPVTFGGPVTFASSGPGGVRAVAHRRRRGRRLHRRRERGRRPVTVVTLNGFAGTPTREKVDVTFCLVREVMPFRFGPRGFSSL